MTQILMSAAQVKAIGEWVETSPMMAEHVTIEHALAHYQPNGPVRVIQGDGFATFLWDGSLIGSQSAS